MYHPTCTQDRNRTRSRFSVWATGLLVVALVTVAGLLAGFESSPFNASSAASTPSARRGWYWFSGQWQADARTVAAAARWCLESSPTAPGLAMTNGSLPTTLQATNLPFGQPTV